jgi:hypothetical protein
MSIVVNIACQLNRVKVAQELISSLHKQTVLPDKIVVILQGFDHTFDSSIAIDYIRNEDNKGSAERLKHAGDGINLIIDDDFVVAENYIALAIEGHNRHKDSVCSFWGYRVQKKRDWGRGIASIDCYQETNEDIKCLMLGVGLSIWDESIVPLRNISFEYHNYVDIQLGVYCKDNGIEMYKLAQPTKIVKDFWQREFQSNALWKGQRNHSQLFQQNYLKLTRP